MPPKLTFRTPSGFHFRTRAIGFLEGEEWLDAGEEFDGLREKDQEAMRNRIDHWLGGDVFKKYHHGFNAPEHRNCYVFKLQSLRLYGFLCHPKLESDRRFWLCVLTSGADKKQWKTESLFLDRAMRMLADIRAKEAIATTYPEYHRRKKASWQN
jgi:hypothetical protein